MSWENVNLLDISRPRQWKTLSMDQLQETGFPVYGANGKIGFYKEYTHSEPTLMITCRGATCGNVHISEPFSYISGNAMALDNLSDEFDKKFLYYYFHLKGFVKIISGSAQPQITREGLSKVFVPKAPIAVQQKIAAILDQADALRKNDQQLLAKYDELLQAVFYDMFGDPVRNEKGWDKVELKEISSEIVDCPHSTPVKAKKKTDYACIRTSELKEGSIFWDSMQYVEASEYAKRVGRLIPKEGDIVYGREGSFGEAIIIPPYPKFCLGQRTMLFRPNYKKCNSLFLWAIVRSDYVYNQALRKNSGSTVGHVNVKDIKEFTVILPSIEVQNKYSIIVANILDQKRQAKQHVDQSENLFQSLLQRAFRG